MMGRPPRRLSGFIMVCSSLTFDPALLMKTLKSHRLREKEKEMKQEQLEVAFVLKSLYVIIIKSDAC